MSLGPDNVPNGLDTLIAENSAVLERFADDGVDISRPVIVEFGCDFEEEEAARTCIGALEAAVTRLSRGYEDLHVDLRLNEIVDGDGVSLILAAGMVLEPVKLSVLEKVFADLGERHGGSEVYWEFADPGNESLRAAPAGETLH